MGLIVDIFRTSSRGDCTNNGISSTAHNLCLVNVDGPFSPREDSPAAMLIKGNLAGTARIVPAKKLDNGSYIVSDGWWMMGGNYAAVSDTRFSEAIERILGHRFYGAVAIHDRREF